VLQRTVNNKMDEFPNLTLLPLLSFTKSPTHFSAQNYKQEICVAYTQFEFNTNSVTAHTHFIRCTRSTVLQDSDYATALRKCERLPVRTYCPNNGWRDEDGEGIHCWKRPDSRLNLKADTSQTRSMSVNDYTINTQSSCFLL
jgi:hypothetical protein